MSTLSEFIRGMVSPQLIGSLAARTGIPETKVRSGVSSATSTIMSSLTDKARDPRAMDDIVALIDRTPDVEDPAAVLDDDSPIRQSGNRFLGLLSHDTPGVLDRFSSSLGMGAGAAHGVLGTVAALVLGGLRTFSRSRGGIDGSMLSSALINERSSLRGLMPVGATDVRERVVHEERVVRDEPPVREREIIFEQRHVERGRRSMWPWLLALVPVVLVGLWLINRQPDRVDEAPEPAPLVRESEDTSSTVDEPSTMVPAPAIEPSVDEPMPPSTLTQRESAVPEQPTEPAAQPMTPGETQGTAPQAAQPSAPSDDSTVEPAAPGDDPTAAQPGASADDETASLEIPPGSVEAKLLAEVQSPTAKGPSEWMTLDAATFATGSSEVVQDADAQLERVAKILEENPDVKLELGGFTSGPGSAAINRKLSQARADAVKAALVDKGIDASRLKAKGYGETQPVDATEDDAEANRRVAMRIIDR